MAAPVIDIRNLHKHYLLDHQPFEVLKGVSVAIEEGEFVAIMGRSGSGKSTFMNILGTLDRPSSGDYILNGQNVSQLPDDALAAVRNETLGFVFQNFNLLQRRSVIDNVALPLMYMGVPSKRRREIAQSFLDMVGLPDHADRLPTQLSGGQQQRVAIARALAASPRVILADEPTGNLDSKTAVDIMNLLTEINRSRITVILVTHELKISAYAHRVIHFKDGLVMAEDRD